MVGRGGGFVGCGGGFVFLGLGAGLSVGGGNGVLTARGAVGVISRGMTVRRRNVAVGVSVADGMAVDVSVAVASGVSVGVSVGIPVGVSVGVLVGVSVIIGIDVAVGAPVAKGDVDVGVINETICRSLPGSTLACQPAGKVAC